MAKWYVDGSYMTHTVASVEDIEAVLSLVGQFHDYDVHSRANGPTFYALTERVVMTFTAWGRSGPMYGEHAFLAADDVAAPALYTAWLNRWSDGQHCKDCGKALTDDTAILVAQRPETKIPEFFVCSSCCNYRIDFGGK